MKGTALSKSRIRQFIFFGAAGALGYSIPVFFFLHNRSYQNLYYIYIGTAVFMAVIFLFTLKLLSQPYHNKRATTMLFDGLMATIAGIVLSWIFLIVLCWIFFGNIFTAESMNQTLPRAPGSTQFAAPAGLLIRLMAITLLCNFGGGSFISVITSYAGKFNQTKDKSS